MPPAATSKPLRLLPKFAMALAVAVGATVCAEFVVRAAMPRGRLLSPTAIQEFRLRAEREASMIRPDQALGHAPVLGGPVYDEHGLLREWAPAGDGAAAPRGVRRVLFLGDSVTRRATLVRPLRALAGDDVEFLNAGVESWNPIQEVEFYLRHQARLRPDHVVLSLHNNDLSESTVALLHDGEFTLCNPGRFVPVDPDWYRTSILYQLWVHTRHIDRLRPEHYTFRAAEVENALARLRDEVAGRGARLTVLVLPILAAAADWQPHERRARELALGMLSRLGVEWVDLQPACEELAASGVAVRVIPTDTFHPGDDCGAVLALAAAPRLFGEPAVRVRAEPRLVASGGGQRWTVDAGPAAAHAGMRVQGPLRGLPAAAGDGNAPTAHAGRLDAHGTASVTLPVPADVRPGAIAWHRLLLDRGDGAWAVCGWPVPMVMPAR